MVSLMKQVQSWFDSEYRRAEVFRLETSELTRIAGEAGVSVGELYNLARRNPDTRNRLPRRAQAIGLDVEAVARKQRAVLRDMQRLCAQCRHQARCERDLAFASDSAVWESYCPNVLTLRSLQ